MMGFENLCATIARAKGSNLDAEEYTWWTNIYQPNSHYGSKRTTTLTSSLFNLYPDYSTSWFARMSNFLKLKTLSLIAADEIASLAVQTALKNSFQPIAVCVMDASGATIVTKRMDGCPVRIILLFVRNRWNIQSYSDLGLHFLFYYNHSPWRTPRFLKQKQTRVLQ